MKLVLHENKNYCATVVRVNRLVDLPGLDNLKGFPVFGLQALVPVTTDIGTLGVVFVAETQLSEEFCRENNLYRRSDFNRDSTKQGYLEPSRRVRSIKLRGHRSDALWMPLEALSYCGYHKFEEGDEFNALDGHEICRKYERPRNQSGAQRGNGKAKRGTEERVERRFFPLHVDTDNWFKVGKMYDPLTYCVITQKLHGTSVRIAHTRVGRKLGLFERAARLFGVRVQDTEYAHIYGSRKVTKDPGRQTDSHYYDHDLWAAHGARVAPKLPKDTVVYGEIIGWTENGRPIQKNYTYNCPPKTNRLYIYRVSTLTSDGTEVDYSWDQLVEFCNSIEELHVPVIWERHTLHYMDRMCEDYLNTKFTESPFGMNCVPLCESSPCDEGIVIRIEGIRPRFLKAKAPDFLAHETKMLDKGEEDVEAEQ